MEAVGLSARTRFSFALGAASNWCAFVAVLAVAFALTPFLIDRLGGPRYGVWCVVESILAYFTLLDMGVAACLVRYVARHHATADRTGLARITSTCLVLYSAAGLITLAVGAPLLFGMSATLAAKADGDPGVLPFMLLMLANVAATLPLSVFPSILDGLERYAAKSVVRLVALGVRTAGLVWAVNEYGGLFPLAVVYTAVNLLEHAALAGLCVWFLPGLRFRIGLVDRTTLREVKTYSTDAFLALLAGRVTVQTGAVVIGLLLPGGQVTTYVIAARLIEYAKTLLRTVTATLTPHVSAMDARGDRAGVARVFLSATKWVLYLVLPVNAGVVLFGRPFLQRWVGEEFAATSYTPLLLLSLTLSVGVAQSAASRILYGLGRLRRFARAALIEAGVNVALMFLLIKPLGVVGVSAAVAVPNVLFCLFVIGLAAGELRVSFRRYSAVWVRPLALTAVPVTIWLTLGEPAADYYRIALTVAAGLVPYALAIGLVEGISRFGPVRLTPGPRSSPSSGRTPALVRSRTRTARGSEQPARS